MGAGYHGGFGETLGKREHFKFPLNLQLFASDEVKKGRHSRSTSLNLQLFASKAFERGGHVSVKSLTDHAEYFLGKSAKRIAKALQQMGYKTHIEHSIHPKSKSKKIVVENNSKTKNISTIRVSRGSPRHGDTPYVVISTTDIKSFKIISDQSKYKSDGHETATLLFARRKKK